MRDEITNLSIYVVQKPADKTRVSLANTVSKNKKERKKRYFTFSRNQRKKVRPRIQSMKNSLLAKYLLAAHFAWPHPLSNSFALRCISFICSISMPMVSWQNVIKTHRNRDFYLPIRFMTVSSNDIDRLNFQEWQNHSLKLNMSRMTPVKLATWFLRARTFFRKDDSLKTWRLCKYPPSVLNNSISSRILFHFLPRVTAWQRPD